MSPHESRLQPRPKARNRPNLIVMSCAAVVLAVMVTAPAATAAPANSALAASAGDTGAMGGWKVVATPSASQDLLGVTCPKVTACWAVGSAGANGAIDHWNGSAWSVSTSYYKGPQGGGNVDKIFAAASAKPLLCFAVGGAEGNAVDQAFIEASNAKNKWTLVPTTNVNGLLRGVACPSVSDCWAVGTNFHSVVTEHWTGSHWKVAPSPKPGGGDLYAVSCPTTTACFAVGSASGKNFTEIPLIERWNGKAWSKLSAPSIKLAQLNTFFLTGVSCTSAKFCVATGPSSSNDTTPGSQILVEQWNGSHWSFAKAPVVTATGLFNETSSVACSSKSDCWVVSTQQVGSSLRVLTEAWNGKTWMVTHSANATPDDGLYAVSCPTANTCWAVGATTDKFGDIHHTLAERYTR